MFTACTSTHAKRFVRHSKRLTMEIKEGFRVKTFVNETVTFVPDLF